MNINEFSELKAGDRVRNDMTHSDGTVTELLKDGVRVQWGAKDSTRSVVTFAYTVNSTAWYHWSTPDENKAEGIA